MGYLLDYGETQFSSFEELPFNAIDAAALSQVVGIKAEKVVPALRDRPDFADQGEILHNLVDPNLATVHFKDMLLAEHFAEMFGTSEFSLKEKNLVNLAASPRFREMLVCDYISLLDLKRSAQFAAMSFIYKDQFGVVGYRGTDSTFTGWQEDLNMAFETPVPAQAQAVQYLETVAKRLPEKIYVIGHSKGGNLAEYASVKANQQIQDRIVQVYNLDGPGFKEDFLSDQDYALIIDRIVKIVPPDSYSGTLLFSPVPMKAVPSNAKGFSEHSVFTWEVAEDNRDFKYQGTLSESSQLLGETVRRWIVHYDSDTRKLIANALLQIVAASHEGKWTDLFTGGTDALMAYLKQASITDKEDAVVVLRAAKRFLDEEQIVAAERLERGIKEALSKLV